MLRVGRFRSVSGFTLLLAGAMSMGCQGTKSEASRPAVAAATAPSPIERGKYLVNAMACNECHTPLVMGPTGPAPDMTRMLSGHPESLEMPPAPPSNGPWMGSIAATGTAFAGPWGVTYAANLTPDQNTGLGIWTEELFLAAMKTGKHMGTSRPIQPPMPWNAYSQMTDEDLRAIFAYLKSIPPLTNHVPDYEGPAGQ